MDDKFAAKLRRLGIKTGTDEIPNPPAYSGEFSVDEVIPGELLQTIFGSIYRIQKFFNRSHIHGKLSLIIEGEIDLVADWAHLSSSGRTSLENFVYLDTETTGLSGGTGTFAFLVGLSRYNQDGTEFTQFLLRDPSEERAMLTALADYMNDAHGVVTYNGKAFDIPLLNSRYVIHRLESPFAKLDHIDLLYLARRMWKKKLASRRLSNVEVEILRVERSQEEVPGYLVPQIYFDYLKTRDARPLAGVLYHNEMDVLSMAALLNYFTVTLSQNEMPASVSPDDYYPLVTLLLDLGKNEDACRVFASIFHPAAKYPNIDWDVAERIGKVYRRNADWEDALVLWQSAAEQYQEFGWEELAKYYEHVERNYPAARYYAESQYNYVSSLNLGPYTKQQRLKEIQKRIDRIKDRPRNNPA